MSDTCYESVSPPRFDVNEGDSMVLRAQLLDEMRSPIAKSSVDSLIIELYDVATNATINERTDGGAKGYVLDDNGGTLTDTYAIQTCSKASPALLTFTAGHKLQNGDRIKVSGVVGMTELNDRTYTVEVASDMSVFLAGVDSRDYSDITPGQGDAAVALIEIELDPEDSPLVDPNTPVDAYEEHRAQLTAEYETKTKKVTTEYGIFVKNLQKRTTSNS